MGEQVRATVKDVAARAGVSPSTVSNVLHDYPFIAAATRARVLAAVEATGYRPSSIGRSLRSGRSNVVSLAIPDLRLPHFAELAHAMRVEADRRGLVLLVDETGRSPERELQAAEGYDGTSVRGVLLFVTGAAEERLRSAVRRVPLITLGLPVPQPWTDHLLLDSDGSARALVSHLVSQGRTRFAYLTRGAEEPSSIAAGHVRSIRAALGAHGLALAADAVVDVDGSGHADGADGMGRLLASGIEVDAVLTLNGTIASGALSALRRAGLAVPDRVAVAGWGGAEECAYTTPSLTAIDHDQDALARLAFDLFARRHRDPAAEPVQHLVRWTISVRESTGGPAPGAAA